MAAISPVQNPQFDSLGRSPEALPFWSRYSLPQRVVFPAANTKRDVAHGLGAIPSGYLVLWSDAPITATPGVNWTPEIAYLQSPVTNARAIVIFVQLRESVALGAGGELLGPPPVIAPPTSPPWHVINNIDTGTIHNWAPAGVAGNTIMRWYGSADLVVTGLTGGVQGQLMTIKNAGASVLYFRYADVNSLAANRFYNFATSGPTPVAPNGSITYYYNGAFWELISHEQGAWITPPFSAANFTGSGGTWTLQAGDIRAYKYRLSGKTLMFEAELVSTTVGAGNTGLLMTVPGGYACMTPYPSAIAMGQSVSVGSINLLNCVVFPPGTVLSLAPNVASIGSNWTAGEWHILGVRYTTEVS